MQNMSLEINTLKTIPHVENGTTAGILLVILDWASIMNLFPMYFQMILHVII